MIADGVCVVYIRLLQNIPVIGINERSGSKQKDPDVFGVVNDIYNRIFWSGNMEESDFSIVHYLLSK